MEEMFPWSGSRQWKVEVSEGQAVVVCSLLGPNNRTLGRLHALVTTDTEHTDECSAIGECNVGNGKRGCFFNQITCCTRLNILLQICIFHKCGCFLF